LNFFLSQVRNSLGDHISPLALAEKAELVAVQDLLAPIDFIRKPRAFPFRTSTTGCCAILDLGTARLIPVMHRVIRASHQAQVEVLRSYWNGVRVD
jgi:hypothetical protein